MKCMCPIKMEYHKFLRHLPHKKKGEKKGSRCFKVVTQHFNTRCSVSWPVAIHYQRADTLCIFNATHRQMCKKPAAYFFFSTSVGFYLHLVNFIDNAYTKNYIVLQQSTPIYLPGRLLNYPCINIFF